MIYQIEKALSGILKNNIKRRGTPGGCKAVNLYDEKLDVIEVYEKETDRSNLFLTTCKLTNIEKTHLKSTNGHFVTEKILK